MTGTLRRLTPLWLLGLLAFLAGPTFAESCPFCGMQGKTLTGEVNDASMVLYGSLKNARLAPGNAGDGTTDLVIEAVIKKHEILGDQKMVVLDRYVPESDKDTRFLVFCDVFKGKVDPYRGVAVKTTSGIDKYLQGRAGAQG